MGSSSSGQALVWQPTGPKKLPEGIESRMAQEDGLFAGVLLACIGRLSWKRSSWEDVAGSVATSQSKICQALSKALELENAELVVTEVQLHVLRGSIGKQEQTGWTWKPPFFMDVSTPRFSTQVSQTGQVVPGSLSNGSKSYSASVGEDIRRSPIPPLPSLEEFGVQSSLDDLRRKYTEEGDVYGLLMQHPYQVIEWLGGNRAHEQWGWACEMVILSMKVENPRAVILQLNVSQSESDGPYTITAVTVSGEEACSFICSLDMTTAASLLEEFAEQMRVTLEDIKLIAPNGDIIDHCVGHLMLTSLLSSSDT